MSSMEYFRALAARCRASAVGCHDQFAKEEFRRLAREFESKADQLVHPGGTADQSWWLNTPEQAHGFAGDR
jgi:hypothetical protein